MLDGETIQLRLIRESDLDTLFICLTDIRNRGDYFPIKIHSESWLRKQFQDGGFWDDDKGLLLMINKAAAIIGHIEFFRPVAYLDAYELSYLLYNPAERGKGATSEAVCLLTRYIFDTKKVNRLQLVIHPENVASRRAAHGITEANTTMLRYMLCYVVTMTLVGIQKTRSSMVANSVRQSREAQGRCCRAERRSTLTECCAVEGGI